MSCGGLFLHVIERRSRFIERSGDFIGLLYRSLLNILHAYITLQNPGAAIRKASSAAAQDDKREAVLAAKSAAEPKRETVRQSLDFSG